MSKRSLCMFRTGPIIHFPGLGPAPPGPGCLPPHCPTLLPPPLLPLFSGHLHTRQPQGLCTCDPHVWKMGTAHPQVTSSLPTWENAHCSSTLVLLHLFFIGLMIWYDTYYSMICLLLLRLSHWLPSAQGAHATCRASVTKKLAWHMHVIKYLWNKWKSKWKDIYRLYIFCQ